MPEDFRFHLARGCWGDGGGGGTNSEDQCELCVSSLIEIILGDMGAFYAFLDQRVNLNSSFYVCLCVWNKMDEG